MRELPRKGLNLRTVAAFAFGAAAGGIVALLYAPASGKVTRQRLAMRVRRIRQLAGRRIVQTRDVLARQAGRMQQAATGWISDHLPHESNGHRSRRRVRHAHAIAK